MKNVLVISSSPRKNGNSDKLCDSFIKGALEKKHKVEKIRLQEQNIKYCIGCRACSTTKVCVHKDDMTGIIEKMLGADVIVLATPVYFYSMSAQLKTMIDRTLPRYKDIANKEFYLFTTAAEKGKQYLFTTIDSLKGFVDNLDNNFVREVIMVDNVNGAQDILNTEELDLAYQYGLTI